MYVTYVLNKTSIKEIGSYHWWWFHTWYR